MKKIVIIVFVFVVMAGLLFLFTQQTKQSPTQKVEKLEGEIEQLREESGYNECITKIEENEKKYELCVSEELNNQGYGDDQEYNDGIDCITEPTNIACDDDRYWAEVERYNAEVDAENNCLYILDEINLTIFDCESLLEEQ
jgi:c-di-AMP phosphodiesterase-like protein